MCYCSQDNVKQVDRGENFTAEVLKDTVSGSECHTDAITQLNSCTGLPVDSVKDANILMRFSDLADKYWNGSKSLLTNQRFTSQCRMLADTVHCAVISRSTVHLECTCCVICCQTL